MKGSKRDIRLIISCDTKGIAEELLLDSDDLFKSTEFPIGLPNLVAPDSLDVLANLWLQVMDKAMEENVSIKLQSKNREIKVTFSGYLLKDKILLCGSNSVAQTEKVLSDIYMINNEQQNHLRRTEKKLISLQRKEKREMNEKILNDFSLLNNELINKQRELAQKNAKILQLNEKLEAANENMQMFAYSVSHDLKEPVRMVNSFMKLFHKKYGESLDDKAHKYVNFALDGAGRLDGMINDLLEYYRASGIKSDEMVDLNEVMDEVLELLQKQITDRNARIAITSLPVLQGSHTGWRQIFQNLVSNAIKFVPEKRSPEINISATQGDKSWQISVSDNGIGIEPEFQDSVFIHFKRLHKNSDYEGTGMGLAIVKRIVENFDGDIKVESEPDKGSTFTITIGSTQKVTAKD